MVCLKNVLQYQVRKLPRVEKTNCNPKFQNDHKHIL